MTDAKRIAELEAENLLLRQALADQAAALAGHAARETAERERQDARRRVNRQNYERRKARESAQTSDSDRIQTLNPPSPPLDGSPLPSVPSFPSPLSSPHPLSPAVAVAAPEVDERQQVMPGFEPPPRPTEPVPESPKPPRKLSPGEELYAKIQRVRQAICEDAGESFVDDRWEFARQNKILGPIAKGSERDKAVFDTAFTEYVSDEAHKAKGWPLSLFMHGPTRARYEKKALDALRASA